MKNLFFTRRNYQQKKLAKYLRYVLNDHFTLLIFFIFGGGLFYYSQFLKTLEKGIFVYLLAFVLLMAPLSLGHLATFLQKADSYYLLPKEKELPQYFHQAFFYSLIFPSVVLLLATALVAPLLILLKGYTFLDLFGLFVLLLLIKSIGFLLEIKQNYGKFSQGKKIYLGITGLFLLLSLGHEFFILLGIIVALPCFWWLYRQLFMVEVVDHFSWDKGIEKEALRQKRIFQFIALFTDVPDLKTKIKRRKYLDGLLRGIQKKQSNTYLYLYARRFLRGNDYLKLFFSLTSLGIILMLAVKNNYALIGISLLFNYLFAFQLLPLFQEFDYLGTVKLYPVEKKDKLKSFQKILLGALFAESLVFLIVSLFLLPINDVLLLFMLLLGETVLFTFVYGKSRLKKF